MKSPHVNIKIVVFIVSLLFLFLNMKSSYAQGCSDAGFCTIHSLKPDDQEEEINRNHLSAGISYGKGENSISIISPYIEYTRNISSSWAISGKILYSSIKGDLANVSGLSDAFISSSYVIGKQTGVTLGVKIPFDDGNSIAGGLPLPMSYQKSLGTVDLIAGVNHSYENFEFMAAVQQPLTQNKNQFSALLYPAGSEAEKYISTLNYKRMADVLVRASYTFTLERGKFKIIPGILPIFHIAEDKYTDTNGIEQSISGSQGVTINANLFLIYSIDSKNSFEFSFGAPVKSRTARPDGLTRKFAFALEYKASF